ncbi:MAG: hypothetical protein BAJALOKI1v1_960003 [Promethearchaeota archaeon]|nr:MAG: hypothetical protein BAJALOKI1v1_960003 [Candidatus Lokiarchaeota archaeon]
MLRQIYIYRKGQILYYRKLTNVGDSKAKKVLKEEVAKRSTSGLSNVTCLIHQQNYLRYFTKEENKHSLNV